MPAWLSDAVARLGADPLLQGLIAALATFVLEDPTTVGCGLLVADGRMHFLTAFVGVASGIAIGDLGLYGIGRLLGPRIVRWGWVSERRIARAGEWFRRNLVSAVLLSRFVPGMRLPTYLGAGVLHAPFHRFLLVVIGATLVWTLLLLSITVAAGEALLPLLGRARWPLAIGAILLFIVLQRRAARRFEASSDRELEDRVTSPFEFWPPWLFYIPVGVYCAWLALRYRGPLLPTAANPAIFSGGLIGESKSEILDLVPEPHRHWIAPYIVYELPREAPAPEAMAAVRRALARAGLDYPLVAKPDVGQRGAGVRPIRDPAALEAYLLEFPSGQRMLLQELVGEQMSDTSPATGPARASGPARWRGAREAGVLYWRDPDTDRGQIFSITLKWMPEITGDGHRTVRELIRDEPRASRLADLYLERCADSADRVLAEGERLPLVFAGNHCQGAIFRDGTELATPELLMRLHEIACDMPEFWFGRFDIRFDDFDAFLRGEDLQIIEINGAGAEATHIWDASVRLSEAYATLFEQFAILFRIGAANRRRGFRPMRVADFLQEALAYRRVARAYPLTY